MRDFLAFTIIGLTTGAIYAIAATGLVLTFTTSRIFNLAHGAVGMFLVFVYYQLHVAWGIPEAISLPLVLLVLGPAFGAGLGRVLMSRLATTPVAVRLTATLALFLFLQGLAVLIWGNDYRALPGIASDTTIGILGVRISYNQLTTVALALAVAVGLWLFLRRTRVGTAMRAVVDDPDLAELTAISPNRVQTLSWAIGSSLAGLAAILIAPSISLNIPILCLLVVSAFAAAIIGRLASIGWTYAGGLALGVGASLLGSYLPAGSEIVQGLAPSLPFIALFVALVVLRQERQSLARRPVLTADATPRVGTTLGWAGALLLVAVVVAPHLSSFWSLVVATGLVYGAVLLSLVLLTGMAGQVSLCQFSFVGIGAVLVTHLSDHLPYAVAALLAVLITAAVGALIALPALRLRGLFVALATFAFAVMCDNLFFNNSHTLGAFGQAIDAPAPSIIGLTLHSRQSFVIAGTVLVLAFAVALQLARRGRFGRALTAMRDSPSAASALGLSLIRTKLLVFAVSAGMAGLAGCLYAGLLGQVGGSQFTYLVSLTALLILAIQGVTAVPGAIIGGAFYALLFLMLPEWVHNETAVSAIQPLSIGLAVLGMVARPEGVWPTQARAVIALFARLGIGPPAAATGVPVGTGGAAGGRELAGSADTSRPAAAPLAAGGGTTTGATTSGGTTSGGTGGTTETAATSAATTTATSGGR